MRRDLPFLASLSIAALSALLAGCGGGTVSAPVSHTVTPSMSSITFASTSAQSFTVSEQGYSGTFTAVSSNTAVATVATGTASTNTTTMQMQRQATQATATTFVVTPVGGGTAIITVTDTNGNSSDIPVSVTGATFTTQQRQR